jgi:DNA-binding cell septation regulator SpoVG
MLEREKPGVAEQRQPGRYRIYANQRSDTAAARPAQRPALAATVKIRRWYAHPNSAGTLLGYVSAELPSGLIINDLKLMVGPKGQPWIAMPSQRQLDREGNPRSGPNGKQLWSQTIEFTTRAAADRFRDLVLDALRRQHPEAFDGGVGQ